MIWKLENITRRHFNKILFMGIGGLFMGCAHNPYEQKPEEFTIENFNKWFRYNGLYNDKNPNIKFPHAPGRGPKFSVYIYNWGTPGIDYYVPFGSDMVASAPGRVLEVRSLQTGRAGGLMVTLGHPTQDCMYSIIRSYPLRTLYAHLSKSYVKSGDEIQRGDRIGKVTEHHKYAKLLFFEWRWRTFIDPDFYGPNHAYMEYNNGSLAEDSVYEKNPNLLSDKMMRQMGIVNFLARNIDDSYKVDIGSMRYTEKYAWPTITKFKYLEALYKAAPYVFPDIDSAKFKETQNEFYGAQPITLTLPLPNK